jgi:dethiobiotin synthetase
MPPAKKRASSSRISRPAPSVEDAGPAPLPVTLIVGTDTDVGKTWVSCALIRALRDTGQTVTAVKPIETGITDPPRPDEDGALLAEAAGQAGPKRALVRLALKAAPAVAADEEGVKIEYEDLIARMRSLVSPASMLIVEGTGGLLSPLTWTDNHLDLAHSLDARVLLVAADRFGTINHTLMALRVLRTEKVPVLGVVLNQPGEPDESSKSNATVLTRLSDGIPVVKVPRLTDAAAATEALKEAAGWLLP